MLHCFTPTPLQKATTVKPWMNVNVFLAKPEADKATPVKVWGFTHNPLQGIVEARNRYYSGYAVCELIPPCLTWRENLVHKNGWDVWIRTTIARPKFSCPTIGRHPKNYSALPGTFVFSCSYASKIRFCRYSLKD